MTDRATFMIISGGVNIYPQEIEDVMAMHPKVADVAVVGVPNEDLGEEVKAVVQPAPGVEPSAALAAELLAYAREHTAHYKCPRSIDFEAELPRLPTGKLYKRLLKAQIEYFTDVLGTELVALYWMHGVANTFHGFLRLNDESSIALVHNGDIDKIPIELGKTHAGNPGANCARGVMQHLALRVKNDEELYAMRDRIRSKGIPVLGPIDHGFCKSIYFAGLENLSLELSWSSTAIDARAWIDPEVVALNNISDMELARYKKPSDFKDQAGGVKQPGAAAPGPHMTNYPPSRYERVLSTPDDVVLANSENQPPVKVA